MKKNTLKTSRLIIAIEPDEIEALDEYRSKLKGIPSRAEVVRQFIKQGLKKSDSNTDDC